MSLDESVFWTRSSGRLKKGEAALKIYLAYSGDYDNRGVDAAFTTAELATESGSTDIECIELYDVPAPRWTLYSAFADVFPDGTYEASFNAKECRGEPMAPLDDHLNRLDDPWDGHTQGHCGEHIAIFGSDSDAVRRSFTEVLQIAIARSPGKCASRHHVHRANADGINFFEAGFWQPPRRSWKGDR